MIAPHLFTPSVFINHLIYACIGRVLVVQKWILCSCIQRNYSIVGDNIKKLEITKLCVECFGYTKKE